MANLDNEFKKIFDSRDQELGLNGPHNVVIKLKNGSATLQVNGLTEKAARIFFDQIDESNSVTTEFVISITDQKGKIIDYNYLPNAFTTT